jgi:hypothetical protein
VHAVSPPGGKPVQVSGMAQINRDSSQAITSRLPLVLGVIAAITFVLLFLLTGSVVLPLKALVLNVLSLTAAFGALVWIFQDGHLGALGTTSTGTLVANMPVLLFCVAFGLSMDYEVFLVSRIREYWLKSRKIRADNDESVALGLAKTARRWFAWRWCLRSCTCSAGGTGGRPNRLRGCMNESASASPPRSLPRPPSPSARDETAPRAARFGQATAR